MLRLVFVVQRGPTETTQSRMPTPTIYRLVLEADPAFGILGSSESDSILVGKRREVPGALRRSTVHCVPMPCLMEVLPHHRARQSSCSSELIRLYRAISCTCCPDLSTEGAIASTEILPSELTGRTVNTGSPHFKTRIRSARSSLQTDRLLSSI